MPFQTGENVGPYRIVAKLGQGGMATVFKSYHPALDRFVAIKVLHPAFKEDPNFLARFQREARVVAKLDHPNIVPIYDYAEHEGLSYLVMKFIEGRTLKATLTEHQLDQARGLEVIEAVGEGLSYAHGNGVLHRDIKPSNILLEGDGGIYLADFGLARIAQAGESTLSSDMLLGTPQYISPEQARGESDLDAGTDIYSFGVVIYEMVVGRVPFNADTPFSVIHDHIYTPLPMPRQVNRSVPEAVERVLMKALAKDREDRFSSVEELVSGFREAVLAGASAPTRLVPDAGGAQTRLSDSVDREPEPRADLDPHDAHSRMRRWMWVSGGLVLACLCLFTFLTLANRGRQAQIATEGAAAADTLQATQEPSSEEGLAVLAARATMEADPSDPFGHLDLAQELYRAGFPARASQSLQEGAALLMRRGEYLEAANALLAGLEASGGPRRVGTPITDLATEAFFVAAGEGEPAVPVIDRASEAFPDWDALVPIRARLALSLDGPKAFDSRASLLDELGRREMDPLAQAVLVENAMLRGERDLALELARAVFRNPEAPEWLVRHVDMMMGDIIPE